MRGWRAYVAFSVAWAVALAVLFAAPRARAHDFDPGALTLIESSAGRFSVRWVEPVDSVGVPEGVDVRYPPSCRLEPRSPEGAWLDCGPEGLHGVVAFENMTRARTQVVVSVRWLDGRAFDAVVRAADPQVVLDPSAPTSALRWVGIGVEHVFTGLDHVAFVVGLFLVVGVDGGRRRLVWTVTSFTVAHSITLALAATQVVRLASAPVEATIAASILLVAREATHRRETVTRTRPWLVAFLFGLVHGLGFAGALDAIGLPSRAFGVALVAFNVGVEIAQLSLVAALVVGSQLARRLLREPRRAAGEVALIYVLGVAGAYWFIDRAYLVLNR